MYSCLLRRLRRCASGSVRFFPDSFLSPVTMVTREFGVGPLAQDSTSCKISREVSKRQVNKVKTMNMYLL